MRMRMLEVTLGSAGRDWPNIATMLSFQHQSQSQLPKASQRTSLTESLAGIWLDLNGSIYQGEELLGIASQCSKNIFGILRADTCYIFLCRDFEWQWLRVAQSTQVCVFDVFLQLQLQHFDLGCQADQIKDAFLTTCLKLSEELAAAFFSHVSCSSGQCKHPVWYLK